MVGGIMLNGIIWRTDVENAPKDGTTILVVDNAWKNHSEWCNYCVKAVQWDRLSDMDEDDDKHGWVYGYDHEWGYAQIVDSFDFWCVITPPEGFQSSKGCK